MLFSSTTSGLFCGQKSFVLYFIAVLPALLLSACRDEPATDNQTALPLSEVRFFAYQIEDLSLPGAVEKLAATHYDMLILEPTRTDIENEDFDTRGMVELLKSSKAADGTHRKLVIAYIDIGEAEDWRWYWTWSKNWPAGEPRPSDWPDYILLHDPDGWAGNYPVAYWDERWQDIVIYGENTPEDQARAYSSIIDEVIRDGFDGIYLDWVEAFENDVVMAEAERLGKDPAQEMISFIKEMRNYARQRVPGFIIIQQNAASLVDGRADELLSVIDAISQEAIWYDGDATDNWNNLDGHDSENEQDLQDYYIYYLDMYLQKGVPVFDVEYALDNADDAYEKALAAGYVPYCTRRSLSGLTTTPPPGY
jgi:cysteinyl-tRNA synthetase